MHTLLLLFCCWLVPFVCRCSYEYAHVEASHVTFATAESLQIVAVGLTFSLWCVIGLVLLNLFIGIITELYPKMQRQSEAAWENLITGIMAHSIRTRLVNESINHKLKSRKKVDSSNSNASKKNSSRGTGTSNDKCDDSDDEKDNETITNVRDYIHRMRHHRWNYVILKHAPSLEFQHAYDVVYSRVIDLATQLSIVWDRTPSMRNAEIYRGNGTCWRNKQQQTTNAYAHSHPSTLASCSTTCIYLPSRWSWTLKLCDAQIAVLLYRWCIIAIYCIVACCRAKCLEAVESKKCWQWRPFGHTRVGSQRLTITIGVTFSKLVFFPNACDESLAHHIWHWPFCDLGAEWEQPRL